MTALSGLSSHIGNIYSYYVGAYLKTHPIGRGERKEIDLREHDFDIPMGIPAESCTFHLPLSLDLLASLSDSEYFAECKYNEVPRSLGVNSREFKEALLEFIGLERYRTITFKSRIEYLFVTNHPVGRLREETIRLQSSSTTEIIEYRAKLAKTAEKKWKKPIPSISERALRTVLNRVIVLQIDHGTLKEAELTPSFKDELEHIIVKARVKGIELPLPLSVSEGDSIAVTCDDPSEEFMRFQRRGHDIRIQSVIWKTLEAFADHAPQVDSATRVNGKQMAFLKSLSVGSSNKLQELAARILTETLNDEMMSKKDQVKLFIQVSIDDRTLLIFNRDWLIALAKSLRTRRGKYEISSIAEALPFTVSHRILEMAIVEANRLKGLIIDDGWFERD